jgi:hypothetical protein
VANAKITALSSVTTATNDDVLVIVDDPSGSPVTKKITTQAHHTIVNSAAAETPFSVQGHASQSVDIVTVQSSAAAKYLRVASGGKVLAGPASATAEAIAATFFVSGASPQTMVVESTAASGSGSGAFFSLHSSDGAALASGDRMGGVVFGGSSSASALRNAAAVLGYAAAAWSDGASYPSSLALETTATSATTRTERTRIDNEGTLDHKFAFQLTNIISPSQLTGNTDNWNPTGLSACATIRVSTDASRNLTGIVAQTAGRRIRLRNVGAQNLVLIHDLTSTAANRFYCPGAANFTLNAKDSVDIEYDGTDSRWYVIGF